MPKRRNCYYSLDKIIEPLILSVDKVRFELHGILELCKEPNTNEFRASMTDAISKMEGKDGLWSSVSGDEKHYMSVMDACETLAECMNVHIAVFILVVDESALEESASATIPGFKVFKQFCGDTRTESIFGPRGGAVITYMGSSHMLLTHADLLVPLS